MTVKEWSEKYASMREADHYPGIRGLRRALEVFADFAGAEAIESCPRALVADWKTKLLRAGLANDTVRTYMAHVATMFQEALNLDLCERNPCRGIRKPKPQPRTRCLTPDETERLLAHCPPKLALIVRLGLLTGIRVGGLIRLKRGDFTPDLGHYGALRVRLKGGRLTHKPLSAQARALVDHLLARPGQPEDSLLGYPSYPAVGEAIRHVRAKAHLPGVTFHVLRRTFAMRMREAGVDLGGLQLLLDHATVDTTRLHYAQPTFREQEAALNGAAVSV